MATQQIEFQAPSGMTLTAKLYLAANDTVAYTASAVAEQANRKAIYRATFSSVASNEYMLIAFSGPAPVAVWWGVASDVASVFWFGEKASTVVVSIPQQAVPIPDSAGTRLYAFVGEDKIHILTGLDSDYRAVLLELKIKNRFGVTILTLSDASLTKTATTISFTIPKSYLTQRAEWNWSIRLADGTGLVQLWGPYIVLYAA